ncbi:MULTISPECIES: helix-turn-helix domain-containing protein [Leuconostoc]|uniref:HxlR family transcriptional regulator n=2 Tax=Leuconostoc TaxID=1243 RepID=K0DFJ7_LEUCJ|nr:MULTISPECIES: helix-turn-helix domain-containing protein [Leuconostoc]QGM26125.1 ArsR family transcriptional regulator [Leuconostoc mesenteroides subsp. mesenteroides]AFT82477.1 HxlR family transcriptional regulator [Leuconostoc carnosum JB16]MBA5973401.1 helix-turn-helix transcriptional regulator [Leuconostoc mesenteroides]MBZ5961924.1 helix-turn-helix transcriptional regulator [Leuconostoc gasicomitatum]MBZ5983819.1 helix-turn-helix transcriptional regulator [Leuconostoc gasicomitatum]
MTELKYLELPPCPVATTALLIGDHWKILIIRELLNGTRRFSELIKGLDGISNKVLSQHLKIMEIRGLVERKIYAEVPVKVEYSLTDIGWKLKPVIHEMWQWGELYKATEGEK